MRRIALIVLAQSIATIAFCQTPSLSTDVQSLPDKWSPQSQFSFNNGQLARVSPPSQLSEFSYLGQDANRSQMTALLDVDHEFQIPPMNPELFALSAQAELQIPAHALSRGVRAIPIPTEWPNARPEPIPTTWANLNLLPIAGSNSATAHAK